MKYPLRTLCAVIAIDWAFSFTLCSENGAGPFLRLRGGSSMDYASLDPQLRAEVIEDAYRVQHGKLPRFLEDLGKYDNGFGQFRLLDGAEPVVPRTISGDGDQDEDMVPADAAPPAPFAAAAETDEDRRRREAREQDEAQAWFKEMDEKYYRNTTYTDTPVPQRRTLPSGPLETYFECRKAARGLDLFLKSIPSHLKPDSPELIKWIDDTGWNDIIHRNGSRYKWTPDFRVDGPEPEPEESEEGWKPVIRDEIWFNATVRDLIHKAWQLPRGSNYPAFFRLHNTTFEDLAMHYTCTSDSVLIDLRESLEEEAGGHKYKMAAMEAFWALVRRKFVECTEGPVWRQDVEEIYHEVEKERKEMGYPTVHDHFDVPRQREYEFDSDD